MTVADVKLPLPAGPVPRALLESCRPGPPLEPVETRDGWALYLLPDATGERVAVRTPDHPAFADADAEVLRCLVWLRDDSGKAFAALQALLSLAHHRAGELGGWKWGEVARAAWGEWAKTEHNDLVRLTATLLSGACWPDLGDQAAPAASSPWGGSPVLRVEPHGVCTATDARRCRCRSTAFLSRRFSDALAAVCPKVPARHLQLPQEGQANPRGRCLSRARKLVTRVKGLHHWLSSRPDPDLSGRASEKACTVSLRDVLAKWLNLDDEGIARLQGGRHMGDVLDGVVEALTAVHTAIGVGLALAPVAAASLLDTPLRVVGPRPRSSPQAPGVPRPPLASTTPASASHGGAAGSRAPPHGT